VRKHLTVVALLVAFFCFFAPGWTAECQCPQARRVDGWCDVHQVGYIAGLPIRSQLVHEALDAHGHAVDPATFDCPACRDAIKTSGFCEQHAIGFVDRMAYFSRLTYEIARGSRVDPAHIDCAVCRKNSENSGWCKRCKAGTIGNVVIRDPAAYARAADALRMVQEAMVVARRCERCAVALVTSSECPLCRISYRDGKPVKN
jgi:hypothetical protein